MRSKFTKGISGMQPIALRARPIIPAQAPVGPPRDVVVRCYAACLACLKRLNRLIERTLSEAKIRERMSGNICRCSAHPNIVAAIKDVAGEAQ